MIDPKLLPAEGLFLLMRVYPNGSAKYTVRNEEGKNAWLEFNKKYRFGNTLFVNRELIEDTGTIRQPFLADVIKVIETIEVPLKERPLHTHYHPDEGLIMPWYGEDLEFISNNRAYSMFPTRYA